MRSIKRLSKSGLVNSPVPIKVGTSKLINQRGSKMSNEKQCPSATTPVKEDKHLSIESAINNLDEVICHAQNILDKALGHPSSIGEKVEYTRPNLSEFLDNSGASLREKIETLHSQLNQIETVIF